MSESGKSGAEGRYSYEGLSSVIHEKSRLSIMTSLVANKKGLSFNELKSLCSLSDGNLSRHMLALENAGMVEVIKGYEGRKPRTDYKVTPLGESSFYEYLSELESVIRDAHAVAKEKSPAPELNMKERGQAI